MDNKSISYTPNATPKKRLPSFKIRQNLKPQTLFKLVVPLVILLVLGFSLYSLFNRNGGSVAGVSNSDEQLEIKSPVEKLTLNKEFQFPLKDEKGKEIGKFSYILETSELTDEIILKGSRATAVKGRQFLIVNLKLINTLDKGIDINSRDFIRLAVNGNSKELLAPDIHNDPVEVQAISTKYTRVGFPINTTDKNLILQIGEINGEKQTIKLDFKTKK